MDERKKHFGKVSPGKNLEIFLNAWNQINLLFNI